MELCTLKDVVLVLLATALATLGALEDSLVLWSGCGVVVGLIPLLAASGVRSE